MSAIPSVFLRLTGEMQRSKNQISTCQIKSKAKIKELEFQRHCGLLHSKNETSFLLSTRMIKRGGIEKWLGQLDRGSLQKAFEEQQALIKEKRK